MYRLLTESEYALFEGAEAKLYHPYGMLAWSDVRTRDDSEALACLWDDAFSSVELTTDDEQEALNEAARRVAVAQYYIVHGELPDVSDGPSDVSLDIEARDASKGGV